GPACGLREEARNQHRRRTAGHDPSEHAPSTFGVIDQPASAHEVPPYNRLLRRSGSMLPPLRIATVFAPSGTLTLRVRSAATEAAPAGSTSSLQRKSRRRTASANASS